VALSLTLLIGAGLLMRSFVALREVPLGLQAGHVFQAFVPLPPDRYKTPEQAAAFFRPLLARLKALPGVVAAAASGALPPNGGDTTKLQVAGKANTEDWQAMLQQTSQEYFHVLRIEFKEGRGFSEVELNDARKVAVVNATFARRYLGNENPIGQRVRFASLDTLAGQGRDPWFEIVGVVDNVINNGLQSPIEPEVWIPYTIPGPGAQVLLVRTSQDPATMMNAVRQAVWATDSGVALAYPGTLTDRINQRLYASPRFGFVFMTIFGSIGLILVTIGVYSVLAYSTSMKTHEIGIRMALGAERRDVVGMVIRSGLRFVFAGLSIGIVVSLLLSRLISTQLVGVAAYDPATLGAMTLILMLTAAVACWIPARRAAQVDPLIALRYE
jgi:putative ABC transport system permease protein